MDSHLWISHPGAMDRSLEGSMSRHPAGKALVPCPACDGHGRLIRSQAAALVAQLMGRQAPAPVR